MPTWSVVWLASVPRSRSGRSAVTATRGTPACAASSRAGWRLATAVPDVQMTAAARADLGQPEGEEAGRALVEARVQPDQPGLGGVVRRERQRRVARARREHDLADRRSRPGGRRRRGPSSVDDVTGDHPSARPAPPPAGPPTTRPGRAERAHASTSVGHDGGPDDRQHPVDRHELGRGDVAGQQRPRGQPAGVVERRQRGRQRDARGQPERGLQGGRDDDRHPDVLGDPQAGAHAAERLHLEHRDVGRLEVAHAVGVGGPADRLVGGDRDRRPGGVRRRGPRPTRTAARRTPGRPAARSSSPMAATARVDVPRAVGVDADPCPPDPSASRTASTRARSSANGTPGVGDLDLGGRAAGAPARARGPAAGETTGTVTLTGTAVAHRRRASRRRRPPRRSAATARPPPAGTPRTGSTPPTRPHPRPARPRAP